MKYYDEIEAIRLALQHKKELQYLKDISERQLIQGQSVGAVLLIKSIAEALGSSRQGKLALWQVIARVISQGSRLSAVRLASTHAACGIPDMGTFNEESLYENLKWLSSMQTQIEDRLFENTGNDSLAKAQRSQRCMRTA